MSASLIRYWPYWSLRSATAAFRRLRIQATAAAFPAGCSRSRTSQLFSRRKAFQTLLLKLRPCSHKPSSKSRSLPAGLLSSMPTRTPSAPYCLIRSSGSGLLPRLLLIFRPCLSRTMPVRYTLVKGTSPRYSSPAMIMRATQKKRISGAVTRSLVG